MFGVFQQPSGLLCKTVSVGNRYGAAAVNQPPGDLLKITHIVPEKHWFSEGRRLQGVMATGIDQATPHKGKITNGVCSSQDADTIDDDNIQRPGLILFFEFPQTAGF